MKPNCCFPLKSTCKAFAIVDFVWSCVAVLLSGTLLIYLHLWWPQVSAYLLNPPQQLQPFLNLQKLATDEGTLITVLTTIALIYSLQKLGLACLLLVGVWQGRRGVLRVWIVYTLVVLVGAVLFFLALISLAVVEPFAIPFYVVAFLVREYSVWSNYAMLKRLQADHEDPFLISTEDNKVTYKL